MKVKQLKQQIKDLQSRPNEKFLMDSLAQKTKEILDLKDTIKALGQNFNEKKEELKRENEFLKQYCHQLNNELSEKNQNLLMKEIEINQLIEEVKNLKTYLKQAIKGEF